MQRLSSGTGNYLSAGTSVHVHYTGKLENGQVFDSSLDKNGYTKGKPMAFIVGQGQVIKCWDQAMTQLQNG